MSEIDLFSQIEQATANSDVALAIFSEMMVGDGQREIGIRIVKGAGKLQQSVETASPMALNVFFLPVDDSEHAEAAAFVLGDAEHRREGDPSISVSDEDRRSLIRLLIKSGRPQKVRPADAA